MTKRARIGMIAFLLLNGGALWLLVSESHNPHGHLTEARDCGDCHSSDAPMVHTPDFVKKGHMAQSYLNWQTCMTCHWQSSCDGCHEEKGSAPDFHTAAFKNVAGEGRMQHVLYARVRPEGCMTCHTHRHATTCGRCHQPDQATRP